MFYARMSLRRGHGAAPISCFGYLEAAVEYSEFCIPAFRFYAGKHGDCLLSVDLFDRLGFPIVEPELLPVSPPIPLTLRQNEQHRIRTRRRV